MVTADDNELDSFWKIAREHAELSGVPVFSGANPVRTLRPPAWGFGATAEQSDELLGLEVDADHARDEGEGDRSLEHWRAVHERFFTEHAEGGFQPDMPVVLERFRVLYPPT